MAVKSTKKNTGSKTRSTSSRGTSTGKKTSAASAKRSAASGKTSAGRKSSAPRKSSATGKTSSAAKTSSRKAAAAQEYEEYTNPLLYYEIFLWLMLAFSIFLFISFLGIGGFVGGAVSKFCFGCFGVLTYLLPFLLFFMTAFLISNRTSHIAKIKAASTGGLYLVACGFMELLLLGYTSGHELIEYYQAGAQYKTGGGMIGGLFVTLFCPAIGMVGTYIVLIIMAIICIVLITQRSLFADMHRKSARAYQNVREEQARRREQMLLRREYEQRNPEIFTLADELSDNENSRKETEKFSFSILQKEPRINNRVTGVTSNTDMSGAPKIYTDEVHQVLPELSDVSLNTPIIDFRVNRDRGPERAEDYFQALAPEPKRAETPSDDERNASETPEAEQISDAPDREEMDSIQIIRAEDQSTVDEEPLEILRPDRVPNVLNRTETASKPNLKMASTTESETEAKSGVQAADGEERVHRSARSPALPRRRSRKASRTWSRRSRRILLSQNRSMYSRRFTC